MTKFFTPNTQQPMVVKNVQTHRNGIQSHTLQRHGIGFVIKGKKYIHSGDFRQEINRGDMFFLGSGNHYTEDVPDENRAFEQIIIYYSPEQLSRILANLSMSYGLVIENDHSCPNCCEKNHAILPADSTVRNFFMSVNQYIRDGVFLQNEVAENLKMTELIYFIITHKNSCIKNKILENTDTQKDSFEQKIFKNIFNDLSIEELARQCNRSLTSFKKEFKKHFFEPPHKWFVKQRLMHSRLLLISTGKSISEIGNECGFPNTSHFIKLFKKEYVITPAAYRSRHMESKMNNKTKDEPTLSYSHTRIVPQREEAKAYVI